jgi:hypothetical protein
VNLPLLSLLLSPPFRPSLFPPSSLSARPLSFLFSLLRLCPLSGCHSAGPDFRFSVSATVPSDKDFFSGRGSADDFLFAPFSSSFLLTVTTDQKTGAPRVIKKKRKENWRSKNFGVFYCDAKKVNESNKLLSHTSPPMSRLG